MVNIMVVEDDRELRELFCTVLSGSGYQSIPASDAIQAFNILTETHIDLIVTDVMMPHMDGFEMTKELRDFGYMMPVLMITAKGSFADKKEGFRSGTDDYMVKPIDVNEMLWRIEALLRRARIAAQRQVKLGGTLFDADSMTISDNGTILELPQKEFSLLYKLVLSPGRIYTRAQIMDEIWGVDTDTDPHTLDVHISRLRERFKNNPDFKIVTIRGLGYKVVAL